MQQAYPADFQREPMGRFDGALASVRSDDLAATAIAALVARHPSLALDATIFGCANRAGADNRDVARMAALLAGLPVSVPGSTIDRLRGSGMDTIAAAAQAHPAPALQERRRSPSLEGGCRALGTLCIGVGQGIAIALEAV